MNELNISQSLPVSQAQTLHTREFPDIMSHQCQIVCQRNCGNHDIMGTNNCALRRKLCADFRSNVRRSIVEYQRWKLRTELLHAH